MDELTTVESESTALTPTTPPAPVGSHLFCATSPAGVAQEQQSLAGWCRAKLNEVRREYAILAEGQRHAKEQGWATKHFVRGQAAARHRVVYYEKMARALEAGYLLIPSFKEIDLLAVRVDPNTTPSGTYEGKSAADHPDIWPDFNLPAGDGEYVGDKPKVRDASRNEPDNQKPGQQKWVRRTRAVDYNPTPEFPLVAVRPTLMDATTQAMAFKVFDRIGIARPRRRRGDPIIVGEILPPTQKQYSVWSGPDRAVTFFIAWYVDTRSLEV